ncbi:MAG: hypothetical protein R3B09_18630 [Nannocystaceae bacterium]
MRSDPRLSLALLTILAACGDAPSGDAATDTTTAADTDAETTGTGDDAAPTYWRDAKAILDARCVDCHSPDNIAPFALTTYAEASAFAPVLAPAIEDGTMPPWPPDAACRSYLHDRSLPEAEAEVLLAWIDAGAPEGDPADAPASAAGPADDGPEIDYDLELSIPGPYTPTLAPDEYRCFVLEWPEVEDRYITAFVVEPGSRSIVHHVIAYAVGPDDVDAIRDLDEADPDPGYLCFGGPGGRAPWIGAWTPGSRGSELEAGTGLKVAAGSAIVVQMHYHTYAGAPPDTSRLLIRTAATVERPAAVIPFTNPGWPSDADPMTIPAGEADVMHRFSADLTKAAPLFAPDGPFKFGDAMRIQAAALHQHTLGTRSSMRILREGGDECVLEIPRWDFNWQGSYALSSATILSPGDQLELECHWDNSAANQPYVDGVQRAPVDVAWGEGTGDEMCLGIVVASTL